jgi:extradiol dioxygenase family protein
VRNVSAHLLYSCRRSGIDLVDDHHVRQPHVELTRMVAEFVAGAVRIDDRQIEVRIQE